MRVGWSVFVPDPVGRDAHFACCGRLPGKQSINRGEAWALWRFCEIFANATSATFVTDSSYVMRGVSKIQRKVAPRTHADIWRKIASSPLFSALTVVKIESHAGARKAVDNNCVREFIINEVADDLAGSAAKKYGLDEEIIESITRLEALASDVRLRAAHALLDAAEKDPRPHALRKIRRPRRSDIKGAIDRSQHTVNEGSAPFMMAMTSKLPNQRT